MSQLINIGYTDTASGPTLVLIHAFPLDREMWKPQISALRNNARVIAVDLPGFGESSPGPNPLTIDTAADTVADFLVAHGVRGTVVVGGLSMGGYVAMAYARRHKARIAGLILADTRSEPDDETGRQNREKTIALVKEKGASELIEQMLPKLVSDDTRANRPEVIETVRAIASRQRTEGLLSAIAALRDRPDATPGLDEIAVPTLILVGEHDAITPPTTATAIAARIRGSEVVLIPSAGHLTNLENPVAFNASILEFLTRLGRSTKR